MKESGHLKFIMLLKILPSQILKQLTEKIVNIVWTLPISSSNAIKADNLNKMNLCF